MLQSLNAHEHCTRSSLEVMSHRKPPLPAEPSKMCSVPPPDPNPSNWFPTPKSQGHFSLSHFFSCWRIWTNYPHMCLKEPHGKGTKKNILLTEHKRWLHQTWEQHALMLSICSPGTGSHSLTARQHLLTEASLSSHATCCSGFEMRSWMEVAHACCNHRWGNMSAYRGGCVFPQAFKTIRKCRDNEDSMCPLNVNVLDVHCDDGWKKNPRTLIEGLMFSASNRSNSTRRKRETRLKNGVKKKKERAKIKTGYYFPSMINLNFRCHVHSN